MKKFIVVLLSALLVLGYAAAAMADVTFSGDARVRGILHSDYDFDGDTDSASGDADHRWWDQRVRLYVTGKVGDVKVMVRSTVSEGDWNGAGETNDTTTGGPVKLDDDDYAYVVMPISGVELHIGRQLASWGNKFFSWDGGTDRFKVVYKSGDLTVAGFTDKKIETDDGDNGNDYDDYGLLAINKFGDWTAGIIGVYYMDDTPADDITGQVIDIYGVGPIGPVKVWAEAAYKGGDIYEIGASDDAQMGFFVHGAMDFDAITAHLALAYAKEEYTATKYFTPTLFFGTSQASAGMNFGAGDDGSTLAIVAMLDYKVSDATMVGGKLAYAMFDTWACGADPDEDSCSVIEFDLLGSYKIAENVTYYADLLWASPSDVTPADDAAMGVSHRIELKF